ncbi:acetate--CoA ligase family protein [Aromatoleum petrolei]|uniref:CoA-binding protein n=1 Tax=Aromatoleum petrolei TaxID=76116 RepID=A0ABX1MQF7_9RHOO|nr:acetate--CoA ligase family protein [Aromatoleum petrolei]NMF88556.1 CoA-binding protein [Aromatoleum petrolei]QTQ34736.1 CoA-binding domain-containing protein [Aromatoleum petrolei]
MTSPRRVYRHTELDRVLNPRSIAIVGASPRPGSFGERLQKNLDGFSGRVYLVNAKYEEVGGVPCFSSISALPEVPDCVAITVAREAAEPIVQEAGELGAGGVILYASGYAETGKPERVAEQSRLTELGHRYNLRILGPNCLGIANYLRGARITFSEYPKFSAPRPESVGIASQSGALSQSLAQAIERGMSVSHAFSAGNQSDVDIADLVAYLAEEPSCRAIACVFEGMANPERLIAAADIAWQADKPLVIHKIATGEQGALAAMSHTGSLAGSGAAYLAAFERAGAIVVDDFEALMETAAFFAKAPKPKARGVAVLATSGGASIMAADKAEIHGVPLPQPQPEVTAILESHIPDFGSARNPCDVTAQVVNNPESLGACAEALMGDHHYGAVVLPQPVAFDVHTPRIKVFSDLAARYGKITCNVLISDWLQGPATREAEMDPNVAIFRSMDRCFATLAAWHKREERLASPLPAYRRLAPAAAARQAAELLDAAPNRTLTEREAKAVLSLYGVPVVGERLVTSEAAAVDAAHQLGYPIAMKVESPDIPHKTEAGVIALNLRNETELRAAYARVTANALKVADASRINGALLQPMIPSGAEIMVGARVDPLFGPLVVVSLGGVLVELLKDSLVAQAPVSADEARQMIEKLKGVAVLKGFRGSEPVDLDRLADTVARLSEFAADHRDRIAELDVNPLICSGRRITAVDALVVLQRNDK